MLRACPHHGFSELHQLDTFYNALNVNDQDSLNSDAGGNFLDKMPQECLKIIESKSKVRQSRAKTVVAKVSTSSSTPAISSEVAELKDLVRALVLDKKNQSSASTSSPTPAPVKADEPNCVTYGGTHSYQNCLATSGNVYRDNIQEYVSQAATANYNQGNTGFRPQMVANQIRPPGFPPHQNNQNNFNRGNNFNQNRGGSGTLPSNTITNPKEELKGITTRSGVAYQGPTIPTPSKQGTKVTKDQVQTPSSQSTAPVQPPVSQSETPTPISEPVVAPVSAPMPNLKSSIPYPSRRDNERRSLIGNKEKLGEISRTPMNEHYSAIILNKLPRKLGDPEKFLIPCEFPRMDECLALADLGASINLMPHFMWEALSLPELTPTCMTLEVADRSVSKPIGIAKDVSFKVGVFHFPADFVVVDFKPDPRVPLILGRCFLKTGRTLIDVHKGELTLRIRNKAITYNLDKLDFLLFEEADAFLSLEDDPDSPKINPFYYDPEGNILLLEAILNSEPLPPLPNHEHYLPSFKKELKVCEAKTVKSSVDEPPEVELKDLPPHLEYAFLEGDNKLPVIIAKELGDEEKSALIKDYKPAVQHQRRVNPQIHDVIKKEVEKLLDAGLIYPISDSPGVSPVHCVPKKGGFTVVENEENELIPTRLVTGWRGMNSIVFSMVSSGIFKFPLTLVIRKRQRSPVPTKCLPIDACLSACIMHLALFKRCMLAIFHDMVEKTMEVFMDDFSVFGNSFKNCLSRLDKMLQRCEDTNLSLNWEKSHFMVKEGIVLGHKISRNGIEVDRAKVDVIAKLPHPTTVKGAKNVAVDHLSRLENPYENVLDPKGINETFPLETLSMVTFRGGSSASWFTDFANYHAGNFIVKGKGKFHNGMRCLKTQSKFVKSLTFWGIDFMGPFPSSRGNKYILMVVDYLSKWVEAKALPNDARVVCKFLKSLFARFGAPRAIISDRGTHFCNDQFAKVMLKYGVTHRLSIAYHPQTSGQVEDYPDCEVFHALSFVI
uniref:Integrase catalytic domain-containing protein n=1 Tax=Tanacetum cinerariifolium TaxID=118510 RepID=A0A6L2KSY8_TANCI|nr:hypothetical protein [Tanacetum cinerariifolium]